jgi:hypothetical protein
MAGQNPVSAKIGFHGGKKLKEKAPRLSQGAFFASTNFGLRQN